MATENKSVNIAHLDLKDIKGKPIKTFKELLRKDATCGGGLDLCRNLIILKDVQTSVESVIYIKNGTVTTKTMAAFIADGY